MRILTWNINGVRTLPQYHPWNTLKTFDEILNHLEADIICFQEMKSSRQALPKQVALPPSYESVFSFPVKKNGYSGVAVYTRKTVAVPLKAEEGVTGLLQPRPPFTEIERVSKSDAYPPHLTDLIPEDEDVIDYKDIDSEGRALVVDYGLFVLINVYCPNDGVEGRDKFKMDYHTVLERRIRGLIREGREVIVVGDLNACAAVEDHCEGHLMVARGLAEGLQDEEGFWGKNSRRWMRSLLVSPEREGGCLVDVVRKLWPDRTCMYTCWNTKISARETNYGTRIDFILVTPGLAPWVSGADIQPQVKGSDHCPVYIDLRDEITNADGSITKLSDVLGARSLDGASAEPPRLAAKYWDEHKQKLLSNFFGKKSEEVLPTATPPTPTPPPPVASSQQSSESHTSSTLVPAPMDVDDSVVVVEKQVLTPSPIEVWPPRRGATKRKLAVDNPQVDNTASSSKKIKATHSNGKIVIKPATYSISNFFAPPKPTTSKAKGKAKEVQIPPDIVPPPSSPLDTDELGEEAELRLAIRLSLSQSQSDDGEPRPPSSSPDKEESKQAWSTLLAPTQIPNCLVHQEPAKEFKVNKQGPNKGKKFFICSRPVGPGYDKGRAERLREQVDPQWRCDFFKWSNDVRREMARKGKRP